MVSTHLKNIVRYSQIRPSFSIHGNRKNVSSHQPVLATGTWFEHVPRKPDVRPPAKRWNIQETTTATSGRLPLLTFIIEDSWQVTRKLKIPHPRKTICSIGIFNKQPPLLREDYRYLLSLRMQKVSGGQTSGLQRTCFGQSKTTWTKSGIELGAPSSQTFPCFPITVHGVQLLKINIRVSKPLARCLWPSVTNGQRFRAENGKLRRLRGKSGILGRCYLWMRSNVSWRHRKKPWILLSQWMLFASLVTSRIFITSPEKNTHTRSKIRLVAGVEKNLQICSVQTYIINGHERWCICLCGNDHHEEKLANGHMAPLCGTSGSHSAAGIVSVSSIQWLGDLANEFAMVSSI